MKYNYVYNFLFVLLISCDPTGNLFITNGYEYEVRIRGFFDDNNTIIDNVFDKFKPGMVLDVAARRAQYRHIIAIRIETLDGIVLAEYTPEYLIQLRKLYAPQKGKQESWIFTEKGLFLKMNKISRRYRTEEEMWAYYRYDEAVRVLQAMLEAGK